MSRGISYHTTSWNSCIEPSAFNYGNAFAREGQAFRLVRAARVTCGTCDARAIDAALSLCLRALRDNEFSATNDELLGM
jgi:hypothetical protein